MLFLWQVEVDSKAHVHQSTTEEEEWLSQQVELNRKHQLQQCTIAPEESEAA